MIEQSKRTLLLISILLIGGFALTSLASYFTSRASLRQEITRNTLPLTSDNIYSEIQRDLLTPIFISSLMASDTFVRDWVLAGERDPDAMVRYLSEIQTRYKTFTSFFVSDRTRNYYHSTGLLRTVSPEEPRDSWYFRVREMAPDYEINLDHDLINRDTLTIFINYKVFDYNRNYIGTTGVGLTVHAVKELIEQYQKRYGRNIYFADRQGHITLRTASFAAGAEDLKDIPGLAPMAADILASRADHLRYSRDGRDILVNVRYIKEFDWFLLVEQAEGESLQDIFSTLMGNLVACTLITLIVLALARRIMRTYQGQLEKEATSDRLTGIHNRRAFDILFPQLKAESQRSGRPFSMILYDIDAFKQVNDSFGHQAGDAVLKIITDLVKHNLRSSDMFFRWGGDEFLLLLKDTDGNHAMQLADKLRSAVGHSPVNFHDKPVRVTISAGVAEALPGENENQLLQRTDRALYAAKNKGRNRTEQALPQR